MKTKLVIGQRIVEVKQSPSSTNTGKALTLEWLKLENGVRLFPFIHEGDFEHSVSLTVNTTGRKPKRRIKQNIWGNWNGYEGRKKVIEFGTDGVDARDWLEGKAPVRDRQPGERIQILKPPYER